MELFKPDNFSQAGIQFKEYPESGRPFSKIVEHYFGEHTIEKIYQVDRAEVQTENFKIIVNKQDERTTILLKKYKISVDREQVEFYLNLLETLLKNGLLVSRVLKTQAGEVSVLVDGELYSAFYFIEGDHFTPSEKSWIEVARNLATMHTVFSTLDTDYVNKIEALSQKGYYPFNVIKEYSEEYISTFEEKIKQKEKKETVEETILEKISIFKKASTEIEAQREKISRMSKQIVHSDFHPHNVLMKGDSLRAIIDFENVRIGEQSRDIAFALYKFGRQFFIDQPLDRNTAEKARTLREIFIAEYCKIRPLSAEEIAMLPLLAKDTFIRKFLFVLKGVYDEGNLMWIHDVPKHSVAIEEINCLWAV